MAVGGLYDRGKRYRSGDPLADDDVDITTLDPGEGFTLQQILEMQEAHRLQTTSLIPKPTVPGQGLKRMPLKDLARSGGGDAMGLTVEEIKRRYGAGNAKPMVFDPEGSGYDYETAKENNLGPDPSGHWPSREPSTGQILKGQSHPTYHLTKIGEAQAGHVISKGPDGRYYSRLMQAGGLDAEESEAPDISRNPWLRPGIEKPLVPVGGLTIQQIQEKHRLQPVREKPLDPEEGFTLQQIQEMQEKHRLQPVRIPGKIQAIPDIMPTVPYGDDPAARKRWDDELWDNKENKVDPLYDPKAIISEADDVYRDAFVKSIGGGASNENANEAAYKKSQEFYADQVKEYGESLVNARRMMAGPSDDDYGGGDSWVSVQQRRLAHKLGVHGDIGKPPIGFAEGFRRSISKKEIVPLVGGLDVIVNMSRMLWLSGKLDAGTATESEKNSFRYMAEELTEGDVRGHTARGVAGEGLMKSLSFMVEIGTSLGTIPAGKALLKGLALRGMRKHYAKTGRKLTKKQIVEGMALKELGKKLPKAEARKVMRERAKNAFYVALVAPGTVMSARTVGDTLQYMLPSVEFQENDIGDLDYILQEGDDFLPAISKAYFGQFAEVISELSGPAMRLAGGNVAAKVWSVLPEKVKVKALKGAIVRRFMQSTGRKPGAMKRLLQQGGFGSFLEEYGEERLVDVLRAPMDGWNVRGSEEVLGELLLLAGISFGARGIDATLRTPAQRRRRARIGEEKMRRKIGWLPEGPRKDFQQWLYMRGQGAEAAVQRPPHTIEESGRTRAARDEARRVGIMPEGPTKDRMRREADLVWKRDDQLRIEEDREAQRIAREESFEKLKAGDIDIPVGDKIFATKEEADAYIAKGFAPDWVRKQRRVPVAQRLSIGDEVKWVIAYPKQVGLADTARILAGRETPGGIPPEVSERSDAEASAAALQKEQEILQKEQEIIDAGLIQTDDGTVYPKGDVEEEGPGEGGEDIQLTAEARTEAGDQKALKQRAADLEVERREGGFTLEEIVRIRRMAGGAKVAISDDQQTVSIGFKDDKGKDAEVIFSSVAEVDVAAAAVVDKALGDLEKMAPKGADAVGYGLTLRRASVDFKDGKGPIPFPHLVLLADSSTNRIPTIPHEWVHSVIYSALGKKEFGRFVRDVREGISEKDVDLLGLKIQEGMTDAQKDRVNEEISARQFAALVARRWEFARSHPLWNNIREYIARIADKLLPRKGTYAREIVRRIENGTFLVPSDVAAETIEEGTTEAMMEAGRVPAEGVPPERLTPFEKEALQDRMRADQYQKGWRWRRHRDFDPTTQVIVRAESYMPDDDPGTAVSRYAYHKPPRKEARKRGGHGDLIAHKNRGTDGSTRAIEQAFGEKNPDILWLGSMALKVPTIGGKAATLPVYGHEDSVPAGAFVIDLRLLDDASTETRSTGQTEGNLWHRGNIPERAIIGVANTEGEMEAYPGIKEAMLETGRVAESLDLDYETAVEEDREYMGAVEAGDTAKTQRMVDAAAKRAGEPIRIRRAYRLFETKKKQPGKIFPLFIDKETFVPMGQWVSAKFVPTKDFEKRPGWHTGRLPSAPHLMKKDGTLKGSRVWAEVDIPADVDWQATLKERGVKELRKEVPAGGHYRFARPANQGGEWLIAGEMRVNRVLSIAEAAEITSAGDIPSPRNANAPIAYDDAGNIIPLSQRFGPTQPEAMLETGRVAESLDLDYEAAVEAGDMETAQRMVDEAAKRAGYEGPVYHGTQEPGIKTFDPDKGPSLGGVNRLGTWWTSSEPLAEKFTTKKGAVHRAYLQETVTKAGRRSRLEFEDLDKLWSYILGRTKRRKIQDVRSSDARKLREELLNEGKETINIWDTTGDKGLGGGPGVSYTVVLNPDQIESAAPVTRDDAGNIIPLSQRFDPTQPEIMLEAGRVPAEIKVEGFNKRNEDFVYEGKVGGESFGIYRDADSRTWHTEGEGAEERAFGVSKAYLGGRNIGYNKAEAIEFLKDLKAREAEAAAPPTPEIPTEPEIPDDATKQIGDVLRIEDIEADEQLGRRVSAGTVGRPIEEVLPEPGEAAEDIVVSERVREVEPSAPGIEQFPEIAGDLNVPTPDGLRELINREVADPKEEEGMWERLAETMERWGSFIVRDSGLNLDGGDLASDVVLKLLAPTPAAIQDIKNLKTKAEVQAFLYAVVRNNFLDHAKRQGTYKKHLTESSWGETTGPGNDITLLNQMESIESQDPTVAALLAASESEELIQYIWIKARKLPKSSLVRRNMEAAWMHYVDGWSASVVGEKLGLTSRSVLNFHEAGVAYGAAPNGLKLWSYFLHSQDIKDRAKKVGVETYFRESSAIKRAAEITSGAGELVDLGIGVTDKREAPGQRKPIWDALTVEVSGVIASLPEGPQKILNLAYIEYLPIAQIARELDKSRAATIKAVQRARKLFLGAAKEMGVDPMATEEIEGEANEGPEIMAEIARTVNRRPIEDMDSDDALRILEGMGNDVHSILTLDADLHKHEIYYDEELTDRRSLYLVLDSLMKKEFIRTVDNPNSEPEEFDRFIRHLKYDRKYHNVWTEDPVRIEELKDEPDGDMQSRWHTGWVKAYDIIIKRAESEKAYRLKEEEKKGVAAEAPAVTGKPYKARMFHGTDERYPAGKKLEPRMPGYIGGYGRGIYVGERIQTAEFYGKLILSVDVRARNPLVVDAREYDAGPNANYRIPPEMEDEMYERGLDSILIGESVMPFDIRIGGEWHQIRSGEDMEGIGGLAEEAGHDIVILRDVRSGRSVADEEVLILDESVIKSTRPLSPEEESDISRNIQGAASQTPEIMAEVGRKRAEAERERPRSLRTAAELQNQIRLSSPGIIGRSKSDALGALIRGAARYKGVSPDEYVQSHFRGILKGGIPSKGALATKGEPVVFYSTLQRTIEGLKLLKATPEDFRAKIANSPGVKLQEMEESGLNDWLDGESQRGQKTITKDRVMEFIQANGVKVNEVKLAGDPARYGAHTMPGGKGYTELVLTIPAQPEAIASGFKEMKSRRRDIAGWLRENVPTDNPLHPDSDMWADAIKAFQDKTDRLHEAARKAVNPADRRAAVHALLSAGFVEGPAGQLLFHEGGVDTPRLHEVGARNLARGYDDLFSKMWFDSATSAELAAGYLPGFVEGSRLDRDLRRLASQFDGEKHAADQLRKATPATFKKFPYQHYQGMNALAFIRFKERVGVNGERVLFIEEIQSDWHHMGRTRGYQSKGYIEAHKRMFELGRNASREFLKLEGLLDRVREEDPPDRLIEGTGFADSFPQVPPQEGKMLQSLIDQAKLKGPLGRRTTNMAWDLVDVTDGVLDYLALARNRHWTPVLEELESAAGTMGKNGEVWGEEYNDLAAKWAPPGVDALAGEKEEDLPMPPDAPFKERSWAKLAMRRMVKYAADNGYDTLAWTEGKTHFDKYGSPEIAWVKEKDMDEQDEVSIYLAPMADRGGAWGDNYEDKDRIRTLAYGVGKEAGVGRGGVSIRINPNTETGKDEFMENAVKVAFQNRQDSREEREAKAERAWQRIVEGEDVGTYLPRREGLETFYDKQILSQVRDIVRRLDKQAKVSTGKTLFSPMLLITQSSNDRMLFNTWEEAADYLETLADHGGIQEGEGLPPLSVSEILVEEEIRADGGTNYVLRTRSGDYVRAGGDLFGHRVPITSKIVAEVAEGVPLYTSSEGVRKASVEFDKDGRALIRALKSPNVADMAHELGHVFRRDLNADDLSIAEEWAGVKGGNWTEESEEKFARGFERYLAEGKAPTPALVRVFEQFKRWMANIYSVITGSAIDIKVSPEISGVFDRVLGAEAPAVEVEEGPEIMAEAGRKRRTPYVPEVEHGIPVSGKNLISRAINAARKVGPSEEVKKVINRMTGVSHVKGEPILDAKQALILALGHEAKGAAKGYKYGQVDLLANQNELVGFTKAHVPKELQERLIASIVNNARTPGQRAAFARAVNTLLDKYESRTLSDEAMALLKTASKMKLNKSLRTSLADLREQFATVKRRPVTMQRFASILKAVKEDETAELGIDADLIKRAEDAFKKADIEDDKIQTGKKKVVMKVPLLKTMKPDEVQAIILALKQIIHQQNTFDRLFGERLVRTATEYRRLAVSQMAKWKRETKKAPKDYAAPAEVMNDPRRTPTWAKASSYRRLAGGQQMSHDTRVFMLGGEGGILEKLLFTDLMDGHGESLRIVNESAQPIRELVKRLGVSNADFFAMTYRMRGRLGGKVNLNDVSLPTATELDIGEGNVIGERKVDNISISSGERIKFLMMFADPHTRKELLRNGQQGIILSRNKRTAGARPIKLRINDLMAIINSSTETERAIAEAMRTWINGPAKEYTNKTHRQIKGHDLITGEANYDPRRRSPKHTKARDPGEEALKRELDRQLENQPMLKERTKAANAPFMIDDAFEAYFVHANRVGAYAGKALPIANAKRIINSIPFQDYINKNFKNGPEIIEDLTRTITSYTALDVPDKDSLSRIASALTKAGHVTVLGLKPQIIAYQYVSLDYAARVIPSKYIHHPSNLKPILLPGTVKKEMAELMAINPHARARHESTGHQVLTAGAQGTPLNLFYGYREGWRESLGLKGIHAMDEQVMVKIWRAAKMATNGDLEAASKLWSKTVWRTQPTWDPLTTSTMITLARNNPMAMVLILYSSQRSKNINALIRDTISTGHKSAQLAKEGKTAEAKKLQAKWAGRTMRHYIIGAGGAIYGLKKLVEIMTGQDDDDDGFLDNALELTSRIGGNWVGAGDLVATGFTAALEPFAAAETGRPVRRQLFRRTVIGEAMENIFEAVTAIGSAIQDTVSGEEFKTGPYAGVSKARVKWPRAAMAALMGFSFFFKLPLPGPVQIARPHFPWKRKSAPYHYRHFWRGVSSNNSNMAKKHAASLKKMGVTRESIRRSAIRQGLSPQEMSRALRMF